MAVLKTDNNTSCKECNDESENSRFVKKHREVLHKTQNEEPRWCVFNNKGHCKYGKQCFFKHSCEVCPFRQNCSEQGCQKRHPIACKFGFQCQFGPRCSFHHPVENVENAEENHTYGGKNIENGEFGNEGNNDVHSEESPSDEELGDH